MSFLQHLEELRSRIIKALIGMGVAFVVSLAFAGPLWKVIAAPAVEALRNLGVNPPELVAITPRSPANRFSVTPEHPVLVIKRKSVQVGSRGPGRLADLNPRKLAKATPEYVPAGELERGDLLCYPINKVERDDPALSDDFLRLLGYYVAEGCVTQFNGYPAVEWAFGAHEPDLVEDVLVEGRSWDVYDPG